MNHTIEIISYNELIPCGPVRSLGCFRLNVAGLLRWIVALAALVYCVNTIMVSLAVYFTGWIDDLYLVLAGVVDWMIPKGVGYAYI